MARKEAAVKKRIATLCVIGLSTKAIGLAYSPLMRYRKSRDFSQRPKEGWVGAGGAMRLRTTGSVAFLMIMSQLLLPRLSQAQVCSDTDRGLDKYRTLRALSLDLRGTIPSEEEYRSLEAIAASTPSDDQVPTALIDSWLADEAFVEQAVRQHRALLWNNISATRLLSVGQTLATTRNIAGELVYWRRLAAVPARGGGNGPFAIAVPCDVDTPATFIDGVLQTSDVGDGYRREGYVEIPAYWLAPDDDGQAPTLKVCGFDAQTAERSPSGTDCSSSAATSDGGCGCGERLRHCYPGSEIFRFSRFFSDELDARIAKVIREDRPYAELFTGQSGFVNGPLVHFWKYLSKLPATVSAFPVPFDLTNLPDLPYEQTQLVEINMGPNQAGVLTSPAFLLRFQTGRARASRFYDSFLCQPFQAPDGGLPSADDSCSGEPDLQNRCGCKYCHSILEPAAAYWGRWAENGAGYLYRDSYPQERPDCQRCAETGVGCTRDCRINYVVEAFHADEEPYLGSLRAFYFRRPEHAINIDQGPILLAKQALADNRLPTCIARRTSTWLLGRAPLPSDEAWLEETANAFAAELSYRALVRSIVTDRRYRSVK